MNLIFYLIVSIIVLEYFFGLILDVLNSKARKKPLNHRLIGVFSSGQYKKSQLYESAKDRLDLISGVLMFILTLIVILSGFLGNVDSIIRSYTEHYILLPLLFLGIIGILIDIISLPFQCIHTFIIEERFGFNKSNWKIFVTDKLKSLLLSVVIGGGLLTLIIIVFHFTGAWFWVITLGILSVFMLFFTFFYSSLIVPLFNKQTPLPEGELRSAIEDFANKTGFALENIFVIDGSKRSSKANAYFAGLGRRKRIVLYDTLIQNHTTKEIVAILAHEVGHNTLKHVRNGLILGILQMGLMLFILGLFIAPESEISENISRAIAGESAKASFHLGILAFGILYTPVSVILGILFSYISRRNEYAADAFAAEKYEVTALQSALISLSNNNLSNLQPHPAYVFVHYSHPPLLQRLIALDKLKENNE
ncbi:MAG: M48 family metallopeptidase [Bacteroidales bacterium]|nr:M48 family metallopeptidase [Bacteroidales bacterium]